MTETPEVRAQRFAERAARWREMRKFGELAKPRAILWGIGDSVPSELEGLFPTIAATDDMGSVEESEFQVLIMFGGAIAATSVMLHVLGFGSINFSWPHIDRDKFKLYPVAFTGTTASKQLGIPPDVPDAIHEVASKYLIPELLKNQKNQVLGWEGLKPKSPWGDAGGGAMTGGISIPPEKPPPELHDIIEPFVETKGGEILAGRFRRMGDRAECWCFPELDIEQAARWIEVALAEWSDQDPLGFPVLSDWHLEPEWRTPTEDALEDQLGQIRSDRKAALEKFDAAEAAVQPKLEAARVKGQRDRLLLTGSGTDLSRSVQTLLESFGFRVTDADAKGIPGDLLEDLQIEDPSVDGWVALAEVTGLGKGAKVGDLGRFPRRMKRFNEKEGRIPDALWYIVNQHRGQNPSVRPPALHANQPELEDFAEGGGLVIDTSDLFRLWKAVGKGTLSAEAAREILRSSTGRLSFKME